MARNVPGADPSQRESDPAIGRISPPPDTEVQRETMPAITPEPTSQRSVLTFASGRSIAATESGGEERVEIRSQGGELLLSVRLTPEGPVLSLAGASLEIAAARSLSLRAETLQLSAAQDISIQAGGALVERAGTHALREVGGADRVRATEIEVAAHPGGIALRANDDVDIVGERVRLNSEDPPMPETWEEHRARHAIALDVGSIAPPADHEDEEGDRPTVIVESDQGRSV